MRDLPDDPLRDLLDLGTAALGSFSLSEQIVGVVRGDDGTLVQIVRAACLLLYPTFLAACRRLASGAAA